jgi:hypothetical protein
MMDRFQELLAGLGQLLGIPLHTDKRGVCKLSVRGELFVQLEFDPAHDRMLMATFICEMPPGKLRENIFRDALKSHYPFPTLGTLSYSERNNNLSLHLYLALQGLTPQKCAETLATFIKKASRWKEGVATGRTAELI